MLQTKIQKQLSAYGEKTRILVVIKPQDFVYILKLDALVAQQTLLVCLLINVILQINNYALIITTKKLLLYLSQDPIQFKENSQCKMFVFHAT